MRRDIWEKKVFSDRKGAQKAFEKQRPVEGAAIENGTSRRWPRTKKISIWGGGRGGRGDRGKASISPKRENGAMKGQQTGCDREGRRERPESARATSVVFGPSERCHKKKTRRGGGSTSCPTAPGNHPDGGIGKMNRVGRVQRPHYLAA